MEDGLAAIALLMIIAGFAIWCAIFTGEVFERKGYSKGLGIFIGLVFGLFGILIAVILQDKQKQAVLQAQVDSSIALQAVTAASLKSMVDRSETHTDTKLCPECAEEIKAAARVCRYCRHEFSSI